MHKTRYPGVHRITAGKYRLRWSVNGRQHRKNVLAKSDHEAALERQRLVDDTKAGRLNMKAPENWTVGTVIANYEKLSTASSKDRITRDGRPFSRRVMLLVEPLLEHFKPLLGRDANTIDSADVQKYIDARLKAPDARFKDPDKAPRISPTTVNKEVQAFRTAYNWAMESLGSGVTRNPAAARQLRQREPAARQVYVTLDDLERIIGHGPREPYFGDLLRFAYWSGWRWAMISNLTWKQLRFLPAGVLADISDHKTDGKVGVLTLPLHPRAVEIIERQPRGIGDAPVFTRNGRKIKTIKRAFARARRLAGLPEVRLHDLRHVFVTDRRREGYRETDIMEMIGHKTRNMFDRYNIVNDADRLSIFSNQVSQKRHKKPKGPDDAGPETAIST